MVHTSQQEKRIVEEANAIEYSVSDSYCNKILLRLDIHHESFLKHREQESDLERKYDLLNLELRAALSIEDWRKTEEQREREKLLLAELVSIVDKRNELVLNLHSQEQAIEDDEDIQTKLMNVDISQKEKCSIM